ncbi:MAG TPA: RraA family protein [Bryobacteraceae bacterium]|nr:RraA family protein [Bryobacteraceae bacterium]
MAETKPLAAEVFDALSRLDTCTVSNAIERLNVRMRNEGFIYDSVRCQFPHFPPMLGYAVTGRVRTSSPPVSGIRYYYDRADWWSYVASLPEPRVLVIQDSDPKPGFGALLGEVHASIAQAMKCVGCVTNGAVRDLDGVERLGFHFFSGSVTVSHAYAHIIEFGQPVEVGGVKIYPGDLVHGDRNGVHLIPASIASEIPAAAEAITKTEQALIEFCRSSNFSFQELIDRLERLSEGGRNSAPPQTA